MRAYDNVRSFEARVADTIDIRCPRCHVPLRLTVGATATSQRTHWACPACGALERHELGGVVTRVVVRYERDQDSRRTKTVSSDT
jgi:hypothetical protein